MCRSPSAWRTHRHALAQHALGTHATLSRVQDVCRFACTEHLPAGLLESLLPGPVTLLLERLPGILCDELNPGLLRIGVRVPDSAFVRAVAREFGAPLALTSANRSGGQSSVSVAEFSELWHAVRPETVARIEPPLTPVRQCAAVFDGGTLAPDRRGSTVVDLSARGAFSIAREGSARDRVVATASQFGLTERPLS